MNQKKAVTTTTSSTSLFQATTTTNNNEKGTTTTGNSNLNFGTFLKNRIPFFKGQQEQPTISSFFDNKNNEIESQKIAILQAIAPTNNGKSASIVQQREILQLVRELEIQSPSPTNLLTNTDISLQLLNGTWLLQYTSPSEVISMEEQEQLKQKLDYDWKPMNANEGDSNIETKQFMAKGSISAGGIPVEITSSEKTKQIINVQESTIINDIELSWGRITVSGTYKPSLTVPNRVIVSFTNAIIQYNLPTDNNNNEQQNKHVITIDLSFLFTIISFIRQSRDNGWLETTFIDNTMRIGRGNKGTMFILTKEKTDA